LIALVAPEPAPWVEKLALAAEALDEVAIFAPWATRLNPARWLPRRLRAALARRWAPGSCVRTVPGWLALEALLRIWSGSRAERLLVSRFARRLAAGRLAARWLPRGARAVIAPSLAARRVFAASRGAARILVEDLPSLRTLHDDLDRASARQPGAPFLRRYRAPASILAAQESERVLADALLVRSRFAKNERVAAGFVPERVLPLLDVAEIATAAAATDRTGRSPVLLLAGLATERNGLTQALAAAAGIPATLLVRPGEGTPADLLDRPAVRASTAEERERLAGVDLVLAPALCESHAPEVVVAAAAGVPVAATLRAAGFVDLASAGREVVPGDATDLLRAARELLAAPRRPAGAIHSEPDRLRESLSQVLAGGAR
jgi:hypothetical protein